MKANGTQVIRLRAFGWSLQLVREPAAAAAASDGRATGRSESADPYADRLPYATAAANVEAERRLRDALDVRWW